MDFKELEDRIIYGLAEMPTATVLILGRLEYVELRPRMTETKSGLSLNVGGKDLEVQWNHFAKSDLRVLSQID